MSCHRVCKRNPEVGVGNEKLRVEMVGDGKKHERLKGNKQEQTDHDR